MSFRSSKKGCTVKRCALRQSSNSVCRQCRINCNIISSRLQQGQPLKHGHGVLVVLPIILEALHQGLEAHWLLRSHLIGQIWRKPCIKQAHAAQGGSQIGQLLSTPLQDAEPVGGQHWNVLEAVMSASSAVDRR